LLPRVSVEYSEEQTSIKTTQTKQCPALFPVVGVGVRIKGMVRQINNKSKNPVKTAITKIKSRRGESEHVNLVWWGCNTEKPRHNQISRRHTQKRSKYGGLLQFLVLLCGKVKRVPEPVPNMNPLFNTF
jgi:hypothetical protein